MWKNLLLYIYSLWHTYQTKLFWALISTCRLWYSFFQFESNVYYKHSDILVAYFFAHHRIYRASCSICVSKQCDMPWKNGKSYCPKLLVIVRHSALNVSIMIFCCRQQLLLQFSRKPNIGTLNQSLFQTACKLAAEYRYLCASTLSNFSMTISFKVATKTFSWYIPKRFYALLSIRVSDKRRQLLAVFRPGLFASQRHTCTIPDNSLFVIAIPKSEHLNSLNVSRKLLASTS